MTLRTLALPMTAVALAVLFAPPASAKSSHKPMRHHRTTRRHQATKGHTGTSGKGTTGTPAPVAPPNGAGGAAAGGTL